MCVTMRLGSRKLVPSCAMSMSSRSLPAAAALADPALPAAPLLSWLATKRIAATHSSLHHNTPS